MAEVIDGFLELSEVLEKISEIALDEDVRQRALEAGAKPIVDRARRIMDSHKRTGTLDRNIGSEYNAVTSTQDIGWGQDGFYGRFLEQGFKPVSGRRITRGSATKAGRTVKLVSKTQTGKFVQVSHIKPAYEAEKQTVGNAMIAVYKKEMEGV